MASLKIYKFVLIFCIISEFRDNTAISIGTVVLASQLFSPNQRIVGGQTAPENKFPYQVSLRTVNDSHLCGGCILNNNWILTAAQCLYGKTKSSVIVVVGTNSLESGGDRYYVEDLIFHEQFNTFSLFNDIGLIRVSTKIEFNDRVQPIQLPDADTNEGTELLLSGWGQLAFPGPLAVELQFINLVSISTKECRRRLTIVSPVSDTQICTFTKEGEGACRGDSGGPLVDQNKVVGIASYGVPCGRGYPDVFTRVFSFRDWITARTE